MSTIYFGTQQDTLAPSGSFDIGVFVDTDSELVNAVQGTIVLPSDSVEVIGIQDGNSIVNLWIKKPSVTCTDACRVDFAGIFPGGFNGSDAPLFTMILQAKETGTFTISSENEQILLHDGLGTPTTVRSSPLSLAVLESAPVTSYESQVDSNPPQPFIPVIGSDPTVFDGKTFVAFSTTDKESGVDHYEVREWKSYEESLVTNWLAVESPYELKDQNLTSTIEVRAVDHADNAYTAKLEPMNSLPVQDSPSVFSVLLIAVLTGSLVLWMYPRRKNR